MTPQYWDATKIRALKLCPQKHHLAYVENWRAKKDSVHLTFGAAFARGLERFYKGASEEEVVQEALAVEGLLKEGAKTNETLARSLIWYIDQYKEEQTLILPNGKPAVEVHFTWKAAPDIYFVGHLDRVVRIGGYPYILDQKTTTHSLTPFYFSQFRHSDQMFLYSLVAKEVLGCPISGVVVDAVRVTDTQTEFGREMVQFSAPRLDEWHHDAVEWITRMGQSKIHNVTSCGFCEYRTICETAPHIRENLRQDAYQKAKPWRPEVPR